MNEAVTIKINKTVALAIKRKETKLRFNVEKPVTIELVLRRALNGDYMIHDHPLYDIVIMPEKNKIVTFSKRHPKTDPYPAQDKFFDYLKRKGMVVADSIQGGNVFGSLEATYPINDKIDTIQALLLIIYHFFQEDLPMMKYSLDYEEEYEDSLLDPDPEDSTELGEVPHGEKKGSLDPNYRPYGLIYRI